MPMTPNTEQDWKAWRNLMWSEILTESVKFYMDCEYPHEHLFLFGVYSLRGWCYNLRKSPEMRTLGIFYSVSVTLIFFRKSLV